ncbi:hypothetical protein HDU96_005051 [Phlyctochytrium bullatum]|nr:hypothetical protein HDU96_005051 [Phlyctochytrium bullatum]
MAASNNDGFGRFLQKIKQSLHHRSDDAGKSSTSTLKKDSDESSPASKLSRKVLEHSATDTTLLSSKSKRRPDMIRCLSMGSERPANVTLFGKTNSAEAQPSRPSKDFEVPQVVLDDFMFMKTPEFREQQGLGAGEGEQTLPGNDVGAEDPEYSSYVYKTGRPMELYGPRRDKKIKPSFLIDPAVAIGLSASRDFDEFQAASLGDRQSASGASRNIGMMKSFSYAYSEGMAGSRDGLVAKHPLVNRTRLQSDPVSKKIYSNDRLSLTPSEDNSSNRLYPTKNDVDVASMRSYENETCTNSLERSPVKNQSTRLPLQSKGGIDNGSSSREFLQQWNRGSGDLFPSTKLHLPHKLLKTIDVERTGSFSSFRGRSGSTDLQTPRDSNPFITSPAGSGALGSGKTSGLYSKQVMQLREDFMYMSSQEYLARQRERSV